jgi:peptidoglycan/xylan/chitin deacetylase (PgdA/CDA1 family)
MRPVSRLAITLVVAVLAGAACGIGRAPAPASSVAARTDVPPLGKGPHGLPIPPGAAVAKPAGHPGNLTVLDWAGFRAAVSWTFDDGQPSHIEHYAQLNDEGVPMTFYLTSSGASLTGFDATWARAVRDGHELGNHTAHHCRADLRGCLAGAPLASLEREIDECTNYITQHYPQRGVWTIAAPFGDPGYAPAVASRFLVSRGVVGGMIAPLEDADPLSLPCHPLTEGETAGQLNRQTRLARDAGKWVIFLVHTLTPTEANWYAAVGVGQVTAAMRYGRALGDVWMGTVVDVAAYWIGQKIVRAATPTRSAAATTWTWELPAAFPSGKYLRVRVDGGSLAQAGRPVAWDERGYYEIALDARELTLSPQAE